MKKLKAKEVFVLYETLIKLKDKKLPVVTGFTIVRNIKALAPECESIVEMRNSIIRSYGEDKGDGQFTIPQDKISQVNIELNKILELEIDIMITPLKLQDLETLTLSIEDIENLYPIIEEA